MGSPLGPLFADFCMRKFKKQHMVALKELGVNTWFRYVDDVWARLNDETCSQRVLDFLKKQHRTLQFTFENEKKGQLPFLDTIVNRRTTTFTTNIYHKPTFTGVSF